MYELTAVVTVQTKPIQAQTRQNPTMEGERVKWAGSFTPS